MTTAFSQPTENVLINKQDAAYHYKRSDSLTGYKQLVAAKQRDLDTLLSRINTLKQLVTTLELKDSLTKALYEYQISNLKEQQTACLGTISSLKEEIKRERRKRRLATATGVAVAGVLGYLYLTK